MLEESLTLINVFLVGGVEGETGGLLGFRVAIEAGGGFGSDNWRYCERRRWFGGACLCLEFDNI